MNRRTALLAACLALGPVAFAGSAQAAVISHEQIHSLYTWEEFFAAADGREFPVQIRGNPFAMPAGDFERAVLARLQARNLGPRTTWIGSPDAAPAGRRLVLAFGVGSQLGTALCGGLAQLGAPATPSSSVTVAAAYCLGDRPLTEAYARTTASGPEDRAFDSLLAELLPVVFPRRPGIRFERDNFWKN